MSTYSYVSGWDYFTPAPGTEKKMYCRVCSDEMEVRRNVNSATGFAAAMGGIKTLHDAFSCANHDKDWHRQTLAIKQLAMASPSKKMEDALNAEALELVITRKATKDV